MENEHLNRLIKAAIKQSINNNIVLIKPDFANKIGLFCSNKQVPYICGMRAYIEDRINDDFEFRNAYQPLKVDNDSILKNRLKTIVTSDSLTDDVKIEKLYSLINELIGD